MNQRPTIFDLDYQSPLGRGLVYAGLGSGPGTLRATDSSIQRNHGTLTNMNPATDWVWAQELGRKGLDFDGDEYVNVPDAASLRLSTAFTLAAHITHADT